MVVNRVIEILKKNIVVVVMLPSIVAIHIGWRKMQDNPDFLQGYEKKELPIVRVSSCLV